MKAAKLTVAVAASPKPSAIAAAKLTSAVVVVKDVNLKVAKVTCAVAVILQPPGFACVSCH